MCGCSTPLTHGISEVRGLAAAAVAAAASVDIGRRSARHLTGLWVWEIWHCAEGAIEGRIEMDHPRVGVAVGQPTVVGPGGLYVLRLCVCPLGVHPSRPVRLAPCPSAGATSSYLGASLAQSGPRGTGTAPPRLCWGLSIGMPAAAALTLLVDVHGDGRVMEGRAKGATAALRTMGKNVCCEESPCGAP